MRTDKLDEAGFELVGKVDDKAILVPADVEDGSVISDKVHIISERSFQVRRPTPLSFGNDLIPGAEWCLGLRVSFPNSRRQSTEVDEARLGLRRNASLKARFLSLAPPVIARQKLHWPCWPRVMRKV